MSIRRIVVAIAWAASLLGVGLWAQGTSGQLPVRPRLQLSVITGENLGFQPVKDALDKDGRVTGKLMVKVDGEWHETTFPPTFVR